MSVWFVNFNLKQDVKIDRNGIGCLSYWEELPCGIYSMHVDASKSSVYLVSEVKIHEYTNSMLNELIKWDKIFFEPSSEDLQTFFRIYLVNFVIIFRIATISCFYFYFMMLHKCLLIEWMIFWIKQTPCDSILGSYRFILLVTQCTCW